MHVAITGGLQETLRDLRKQVAPPTFTFVIINDFEEEEHVDNKATKK